MEKEEEVMRVPSVNDQIPIAMKLGLQAMAECKATLLRIDKQQAAIDKHGVAIERALDRLTAQEEKNARSEERLTQIEKRSDDMEDKLAQSEIRLG